ncbi:MAG: CDP-diacylglycerol--serine O-phosphatidyltransferase [Bacteroidales bacterium]|nr:CDP-diacylglycerol--serine O-phosphatidyltransferase [Bacteroidales bacterium]
MKKHIPNFITTLNLFSGCIGIILSVQNHQDYAAYFIVIAAMFDFMDGMAARLLHVKSEIGKELDSLADVVSFGVLPGIIVYQLMVNSPNTPAAGSYVSIFALVAFIIPVLSAVRLAKFNLDTRQTTSFIGLPVPANALFLGSLPLIQLQARYSDSLSWLTAITDNYYVLAFIAVGMSLLLVSEIPLFSLKFRNLKFADNKPQFILVAFAVISFAVVTFTAIPLIILAYILLSLIFKPAAS